MVRRSRREHPTAAPSDACLDLRVSKLYHSFDRTASVHSSLRNLQWGQTTLRFALSKATGDNTPLLADVVYDILELYELVEKVSSHQDVAH